MAIVRYYDPFKEFDEMQRQMSQLMDQNFGYSGSQPALTTPVADVYTEGAKGKENLVIEAHLPNFSKDEVDVDVHEGALEIRAEHKEKEEDKKKKRYVLRESASSFYRRVGLPRNVESSKVKANFSDGVLKVSVPFKELPKAKKISIEGSTKKSK